MSEISYAGAETSRGLWLDVAKQCVDHYPIRRRNDCDVLRADDCMQEPEHVEVCTLHEC